MTRNEVIRLLGVISLVDDRVVKIDEAEQDAQVELWAVALRTVPYADAVQLVGEHYSTSAFPIMPKDVVERWRIAGRYRIDRHVELTANDDLPEDPVAYRQALVARRQAVFAGQQRPSDVRALPCRSKSAAAGRSQPTTEYLQAREAVQAAREAARTVTQESGATS